MRPERLFEILAVAERLKCNTRHSWTSTGRRESVAEHSWRLALMALLVADEFPDVDCGRVVRMCLVHDLGEAFTGDIPAFEKRRQDETHEAALLARWVETLPNRCAPNGGRSMPKWRRWPHPKPGSTKRSTNSKR